MEPGNLNQTRPVVSKLLVSLDTFGNRCDNLLCDSTIRLEAYEKREIIVRTISLIDNFVVEAFCYDYTTVILACVKRIVEDGCRERTEDVTSTKVNPSRFVVSLLSYGCDIILRKLITFGFPFCSLKVVRKNVIQFHN